MSSSQLRFFFTRRDVKKNTQKPDYNFGVKALPLTFQFLTKTSWYQEQTASLTSALCSGGLSCLGTEYKGCRVPMVPMRDQQPTPGVRAARSAETVRPTSTG